MSLVLVLWSIWGFLVLVFVALKLYTWNLNRDEDDTIYLDPTFEQEKVAQAAIIAKVNRIQPVQRLALWVVGAMTLVMIVYYIHDAIRQFQ